MIARLAWRALALAGAVFLAAHLPASAVAASESDVKLARLAPEDPVPTKLSSLPHALGNRDVGLYRSIFEAQEKGEWRTADRLIRDLSSTILMGHVRAQRYLHPTDYRSKFEELADWLEDYADLPQAERIHRLAIKRRPKGGPAVADPVEGFLSGYGQELALSSEAVAARKDFDRGITAWRKRDFDAAAAIFSRLAANGDATGEDRAAGAFWAARSHMLAGRPHLVATFLRRAAWVSDEFYGLLAKALLGEEITFDWHEDTLNSSSLALLMQFPGSRRAVALMQVGQSHLAEAEIRKLAARARPELTYALAALAEAMALPGAQMRVAQRRRLLDGRRHDGALYPIPPWQPQDGIFKIDRAIIYSVMRAESAFDYDARSHADARGLMQVLPSTAALVEKYHGIDYAGPASLYRPEYNIEVGQTWLWRLNRTQTAGQSLIHLVAAYNAGQARLRRWLGEEMKAMRNDPLLFIETLPIAETRQYVKKVFTNVWAYRTRLGQDTPSLHALAENRWPQLTHLDNRATADAGPD